PPFPYTTLFRSVQTGNPMDRVALAPLPHLSTGLRGVAKVDPCLFDRDQRLTGRRRRRNQLGHRIGLSRIRRRSRVPPDGLHTTGALRQLTPHHEVGSTHNPLPAIPEQLLLTL